jgi:thiol-disulfide isomerase/thioredoxin
MTHVTDQEPKPKTRKPLPAWLLGLLIAVVVSAIGLAIFTALGFGDDPTFGDSESAAEAAADTDGITLTYFDGSEGSLADFRGTPVVLNFWASWCPACVAEMPDFEEVHAALGEDVAFVGVNLREPDHGAAEQLVAETGVTYTLAQDPDGLLYANFDGIAMPTSVFIDEDGNIVDTHSGALFASDLEEKIREVFGL